MNPTSDANNPIEEEVCRRLEELVAELHGDSRQSEKPCNEIFQELIENKEKIEDVVVFELTERSFVIEITGVEPPPVF